MAKPRSQRVVSSIKGNANVPAKLAEIDQRLNALKAPVRTVSARAQIPMLADSQETPPSAQGWIFEIKYDGVRVLAERKDDNVELYGRNGTIITARYPEICREPASSKAFCVIRHVGSCARRLELIGLTAKFEPGHNGEMRGRVPRRDLAPPKCYENEFKS